MVVLAITAAVATIGLLIDRSANRHDPKDGGES